MEVILKEDVNKLGHRGDVVKVADGYGRNYLLPEKLAIEATAANRAVIEQMKASAVRSGKICVLDVLLVLRQHGVFRRLCLCLQFPVFLGMAIGIVALKRKEVVPPSSTFETVRAAIDASSRST